MQSLKLSLQIITYFSIFLLFPTTSIALFNDIANSRNNTAIQFLNNKGIISGYADGTFRPKNTINRAELSKILVFSINNPNIYQYNNCFPDVKNEWFAPYVCYAKAQNWISGYPDGNFRPANPVNTAEAIKMILNVNGIPVAISSSDNTYTDVDDNAWYTPYIETAHAKNLLQITSGNLGIAQNMTRGDVAESIYRLLSMKIANTSRFIGNNPNPTNTTSPLSNQPVPVVEDIKRKYKNGTYITTGKYYSPRGKETIKISLVLKNDIITDVLYEGFAVMGRSKMYQQLFGKAYKEKVIGKPIDSISLDVVNGASLTTKGFMNALNKIKAKATY